MQHEKKLLLIAFNNSGYHSKRIQEEARGLGLPCVFLLWKELIFDLTRGPRLKILTKRGEELSSYALTWVRTRQARPGSEERSTFLALSRLYGHFALLVEHQKRSGGYVLNGEIIHTLPFNNKLFQYARLMDHGLPIVPSLLATGEAMPEKVYSHFPRPYIVKGIYGSQGRTVYKVSDTHEVQELIAKFGFGQLMVQQYMPISHDYRVLVLGDRVLGAMKRTAKKGEFRTNYSIGGSVEKVDLPKEARELALEAARLFHGDFVGVDLILYDGRYYILEVNFSPGFEGFEQATGTNVAKTVLEYIARQ